MMTDAIRQTYLQELQIAKDHIALGKLLIAKQQTITRDPRWAGGITAKNAEILLGLLEDTQHLFENHADRLKRRLPREP